jgi:hypothetical protein
MPKQYEIDAAYYQGLHVASDPEMGAELGIPTSPEEVERQIESAQKVAELSGAVTVKQTVEPDETRDDWITSFNLTHPTSSGPIPRANDRERAHLKAQVNRLKGRR